MRKLLYLFMLLCVGFQMKAQTVVDVIVNSPDHTTLETAVIAAGLADDLSGPGPFTVFAPTDAAFAALPAGTVETLLADPTGDLATILLYHVVSGLTLSTDLSDGMIVPTLQGDEVVVTINADGVFINDAQVILADINASNGVVHVIDAVLLPPVQPTNTIMDIVTNSVDHTTLEAALVASGLNETLSLPGSSTLFAPTDAAFALLPAGTVESLLADPSGALTNVLLYHVLSGTVLSSDLSNGMMATTLQGTDVTVTINADGVFINDAQVIVADIQADNGVVHVIDAVLLPQPETTTVWDVIVGSPDHTTLEAAVLAAGLDGALSGTGPFTVFAPTDAAFAALPAGTVEALLADPSGALTQILLYHVLGVSALSTELTDGMIVATLQGDEITVTINADGVFINDAQVVVADIQTDNGVVHVIDAVLLPPAPPSNTIMDIVANSVDHNTLEAALIASGLNETLAAPGSYTLFAPTDAAFAALPAGTIEALLADPSGALTNVLLYHALGGTVLSTDLSDGLMAMTLQGSDITVTINADGVFINDAQVIVADIAADNGVVHVIDAVLLPPAPPTNTILDIVVNSADHNTLEAAVVAAGLQGALSGPGPLTVFAPTDAAFAALPAGAVDALLSDPNGALTQVLLYHAVSGAALSTDLADGMMITTLQGQDVTVTINADGVFINDAQVIVADIIADNGIVHVIDAVLIPELAPEPTTVVDIIVNSPIHNTLEAAVIAAGLADALSGTGPFTVFAPTDDAFAALPAGTVDALLADPTGALANVLLYHVAGASALSTDLTDGQMIATLLGPDVTVTINADGVFINGAQVIVADILADNGVVHVIDAVLLPPAPPTNTILDIVVNSADHNTLEAAVIAAGLQGALSGPGPLTVFAPTDAAFAALPAGTIDALLADPTGALTEILLYHAVGGAALSTDLTDGMMITTLQGQDVTVTINADGVFINDAQVIVADIIADNGVVHVIDAVLLPPTEPTNTIMDIVTNSADHTTLEAALNASGLNETLSLPGDYTLFAPTDAAFAALPAGTIEALLADPSGALTDILLYHVLGGTVLSTDLSDGMMAMTLQGQEITVTINADGVFINDAQVIVADIIADNGVVHVIDAVLLPQPPPPSNTILDIVVNSADHNTLEAAVVAAGLQGALAGAGPLTVFAPTDAAFAALPAGTIDALLADPNGALTQVLLYHAVSGVALSTDLTDGMMITTIQGQDVTVTINADGVFINDAQVIVADIIADNGVVHVIDAVLVPELNPTPATVVDIIVNSPVHNTLETAVIAAGLADDLSGAGPFTVFAPTDAAFAALPAGVLDALLADPTGALAQVLLYHVVSGEALSSSLTNGQTITTLQGQDVTVSITGGNVFINGAQVVMADILADNGVVHVIDAVLTPALSVNEISLNEAVVYPNPAAEELTISMPAMNGSTTYAIYSTTGSLVTTGTLNNSRSTLEIDALTQGMYQLKIMNGMECVTRTFMKK